MNAHSSINRSGITLMEVLISIGILAIGLSSVVALVPAGKSEAAKAVMLDRSANLAMNVLNDAITFGLTRPASFTAYSGTSATTGTSPLVIFDPLYLSTGTDTSKWPSFWPGADAGIPKPAMVFSGTTPVPLSSSTAYMPLLAAIFQSRDDVLYASPSGDDDPPSNLFTSGVRSFQGRTAALISLGSLSGTISTGATAKITAVVFHNRNLSDPADAIVSGIYNAAGPPAAPAGTISLSTLPAGRAPKEILRPGTAVYCPAPSPAWFQVAMASVDEANQRVYVTFVGDVEPPSNTTVQIALDSVGLAERIVTLEGPGPYGR